MGEINGGGVIAQQPVSRVKERRYAKLGYDPKRRISVDDASSLINIEKRILEDYFQNNGHYLYADKGTNYVDRLDVGRFLYDINGSKKQPQGLTIERYFTPTGKDPFDSVKYGHRHVEIKDTEGNIIFCMADVEIPESWSDNAAVIAAQKYFFKPTEEEWQKKIEGGYEHSAKQLFGRVSKFFAEWGFQLGYFKTEEDKKAFEDELNFLQINQMVAFNSPVYFNTGLFESYGISGSPGLNYVRNPQTGEVEKIEDGCYIRPQCHACFIKGPQDNLESILEHCRSEGGIFANGSGIGHDIGALRAEGELLSSGGRASGPMSFFKIYDTIAGSIKSGGKTRRAARMTTMRYHHPDILKFIRSKVNADRKALTLMRNGYEAGFEGEAYTTVEFQNTNISVRLDDDFFDKLEKGEKVELRAIKSGEVVKRVPADQILKEISYGSWRVGDPAVQYESKIQEYNTCKNSGDIDSSNPCSEYMHLNETSCNLASMRLNKFADRRGRLDVEKFNRAARITFIACDIANDAASYPDEVIAKVSPEFRTVGLGYADLGSFLMRNGLAYDSDEGRALAGAVTALLHGVANKTSIELAQSLGTFVHYEFNKEPLLEVMNKHRKSLDDIVWEDIKQPDLKTTTYQLWNSILEEGKKYGFRNAQATVIAPTGTIGRLMDCDTLGAEPVDGLVLFKDLAGGGTLKLVNQEVPNALKNLGYSQQEILDIINHTQEHQVIDNAPHLKQKHYTIFDTAFSPTASGRTIPFEAHIKMLGAIQPFISGAISKTNNLPERATVKDIYDGSILGHKLGLKAVSLFRYNSKPVSVLRFGDRNPYKQLKRGEKREIPSPKNMWGVEVKLENTKFHIISGEYEDGTVGEVFIKAYTAGTTMAGLFHNFGILMSTSLKRGVSLETIIDKLIGQDFRPQGMTDHQYIKMSSSILDFVARWLGVEYLGRTELANVPVEKKNLHGSKNGAFEAYENQKIDNWDFDQVIRNPKLGGFVQNGNNEIPELRDTSPFLSNDRGRMCSCGHMMTQTGPNCFECHNCYNISGGCSA